jgi:tRNA(fMet)-specific endonuclease VapC
MILLDTDHLTVMANRRHSAFVHLDARLAEVNGEAVAAPVVAAEEQFRGWLSGINAARDIQNQIGPYQELADLIDFYRDWVVVTFDEHAADHFNHLRAQKVRIGTMDLKIAAIALAHGALLLSANRRDFAKVPGLRVENSLV